jgi:NTE family protein
MSKIGLALGGGGAKGLAHIGVIRALEEMDIRADIVTGTSMGGVIGAMYAAGLAVDRIEAIARGTGLTVFSAREPSHLGMFGKAKIKRLLHDVLGDVTFDQLPRKLAVVAVDLESEAEVILDSGPVVDAVLATAAFPGVFAPEVRNGHYLIDGGALNNVPFDVARQLGADWVIACNVSAHRGPLFHERSVTGTPAESFMRQLLFRAGAMTVWEVVDRTIAIMQDGHVQDKLAACPPDVMICPEVGYVGLFDVRQLDSCLAAGSAAVRACEAELTSLRDRAVRPPSPPSVWARLRGLVRGRPG